jgi:two-component system chemotaxis response regulator CheB
MRLPEVGQGRVIMAPGDRHLVLEDGCVRLSDGPERHACRPSVDVLFESVARQMGPESVGCLLTGMGRDGAEGLLALRRAGGLTLVQNEATCAVFGMPQEAIRLGAAERVLPLRKFAPALAELAGVES